MILGYPVYREDLDLQAFLGILLSRQDLEAIYQEILEFLVVPGILRLQTTLEHLWHRPPLQEFLLEIH